MKQEFKDKVNLLLNGERNIIRIPRIENLGEAEELITYIKERLQGKVTITHGTAMSCVRLNGTEDLPLTPEERLDLGYTADELNNKTIAQDVGTPIQEEIKKAFFECAKTNIVVAKAISQGLLADNNLQTLRLAKYLNTNALSYEDAVEYVLENKVHLNIDAMHSLYIFNGSNILETADKYLEETYQLVIRRPALTSSLLRVAELKEVWDCEGTVHGKLLPAYATLFTCMDYEITNVLRNPKEDLTDELFKCDIGISNHHSKTCKIVKDRDTSACGAQTIKIVNQIKVDEDVLKSLLSKVLPKSVVGTNSTEECLEIFKSSLK